ncbi:hypothetical protein WJX73_003025 [Symbiochloris irregularis]|uniref:Uncharacterized protein n=1 Tax=Symbiochloris irregularis TaxID=706552 RepID=A0AAW1PK18_9CHLO
MPSSPAADIARSALMELENLRLLLEPAGGAAALADADLQPAVRKAKAGPRTPQSARAARQAHARPASSHRPQGFYSEFRDLGQAEDHVDRITFAMDSADAEIDAAMNRTGEFLQLTEHRLHAEVDELHARLAKKDRQIASLEGQVQLTKQKATQRIENAESAGQAVLAEVHRLQEQVTHLQKRERHAHKHTQADLQHWQDLEAQASAKSAELQTALRHSASELHHVERERAELHSQNAQLAEQAHKATHAQDKLRKEVEKSRARVKELEQRLRDRTESEEASKRSTDRLMGDLREHLRNDCNTTRGWLQQEVKNQERSEKVMKAVQGLLHSPDLHRDPKDIVKDLFNKAGPLEVA